MDLKHVLPCGKCRKNFPKNLKSIPLNSKALKNRENFSRWMFIINNNNYDEIESDNIINMNIPRNTISAASIVLENVDARKDCVREGKEATEKYLIKKLKKV